MNSEEFASITRGLVKRGWNEIEPKVAYMAGSGTLFSIIITILSSYHVPITPEVQQWGPLLIGILGGYVFPSSGQIVTVRSSADARTTTTKTTGAVETIVSTGAIPIQPPAPTPGKFDNILSQLPSATPDDNPTQVLR